MARNPHRPAQERGAVLVLTTISMVVLLAFTAFAIDLGQRNQKLAGAQHAIDAAVITGAQHLNARDGDYTGASVRMKEVIRQNLGIPQAAWDGCRDADRLEVVAPGDTECISFRRIAGTDTTQTKNDIRVRLPQYRMNTIFGSVLGIDTIDLAAAAASNSNNCPAGATCGTGSTTTAHVMTPEEAACNSRTTLDLAINDSLWAECGKWFPGENRDVWREAFCAGDNVTLTRGGVSESWLFGSVSRYIWYYPGICSAYITPAQKDAWLNWVCFASDLTEAYSHNDVYVLCKALRPGLQSMAGYLATTTTTTTIRSAASAPSPSTTSIGGGRSVPTSIDLAN